MINKLLMGIMKLIISLVSLLLQPIDSIISTALPDLSAGISAIGSMFNYAGNTLGFVVSLTGLSSEALSLIVLYYTFKLTVPLLVSTVKVAIKWYKALKP